VLKVKQWASRSSWSHQHLADRYQSRLGRKTPSDLCWDTPAPASTISHRKKTNAASGAPWSGPASGATLLGKLTADLGTRKFTRDDGRKAVTYLRSSWPPFSGGWQCRSHDSGGAWSL